MHEDALSGEATIRPAGQSDAEDILKCLLMAFEPYQHQYTSAAFADTVLNPGTVKIRMQTMQVLVAIADGEVVGTIAGAVNEREGHLRGMAVLPGYRRTGIAGQLLTSIEEWLRVRGCNRITLDTTLPLDTAMKFYEKHGYSRSGRVSDFFGMTLIEYVKQLL